mgnify:CR=1 FL=1
MVDANQAWTLTDAQANAARLAEYPINWLEEPMLATTPNEDWQALARSAKISLAAGENLASQTSFDDAIRGDWLTFIQPDVCKWGGISRCLPIAQDALTAGKILCPHFPGTGIGLAASAHLLAAVGGPGMLEIDSNPNALRDDYFALPVSNGTITLTDEPGLGIAVQPSLMAD